MALVGALGLLVLASLTPLSRAQQPLAQRCQTPSLAKSTNVVCINKYAAVMAQPFQRARPVDGQEPANDTFALTSVPSDPSFAQVAHADFLVFDQERGTQILGDAPQLDFVFTTRNDSIHEAPVYVPPPLNAIIFSLPHQGIYQQQMISLNGSAPALANFTTDPPVYAVNGGKYSRGIVYWAAEAGTTFPAPNGSGPVTQTPGIYALDPLSRRVTPLLNNYFGSQFNSPNDLVIDPAGDIFFTDSWYGYAINVTAPPVMPPLTWRFRPSTGAASVVDASLQQPNGIGLAPDGRTMYITDTGATDFAHPPPPFVLPRYSYNPRRSRAVWAFDVHPSPPGAYLANGRPIWFAEEFADDGFHVSREGFLVGAAGASVDVLSPWGELLVKIRTDFVVNNVQFAGPKRDELWLFGMGGISRVRWGLRGMVDE